MRNKIFLLASLFTFIGLISFTFAFFSNSNSLVNVFNTEKYSESFVDNFVSPDNWQPGQTVDKTFFVKNNNNVDIAVRLSIEETWKALDGTILSNTQNNESIAQLDLVNVNDWIKIGNYYYYKYCLKKDEQTSNFMESVTYNENVNFNNNCSSNNDNISSCIYTVGDYDGAKYSLNINIETIQYKYYKNIWGSNIDILENKE